MGLLERLDKKTPTPQAGAAAQAEADEVAALREQCIIRLWKRSTSATRSTAAERTRRKRARLSNPRWSSMPPQWRVRSATASRWRSDSIRGLGPLEKLLSDETVSEIMVNGAKQVFVERKGKLMQSDVTFYDNEQLLNVIDRIVSPLGRHIDEANPMVDARLPDGSRVNAVIAPLSLKGPLLTIRKFSKTRCPWKI